MWFTHGWQWFSPVTHKHNGIQTVRFNFSLKGLMRGLNKLCLSKCPCTWDHEYPSMHGLSWIVASRFRCKLKNLEFQTNGGSLTWYAPTATPLTPYFNPLNQPKTPVFNQKIVTQSPVFSTLSKILETVHSKTPNRLEKGTQMPLFLWLLSLKDPQFFALHASVWGECCSLKHGQKLENFVFLRQNRGIWWILLGANLIKVMKTKFQFYRLNRPNCYGRTSLEGRDDTQVIIPWATMVKHGRGYILCMILHLLVL